MSLLKPDDQKVLRERFAHEMVHPVQILLYTQVLNCPTCPDAEMIADEIASLTDKVEVIKKNPVIERENTHVLDDGMLPAWVIRTTEHDYGIRYYGLPTGYEFSTLIETLIVLSRNETVLEPDIVNRILGLQQNHHVRVFVTPTCPYCPQMAFLAYQFAQVSPQIQADVIEASEFPNASARYQVRAVPRSIIDEHTFIEGAVPPDHLIEQLEELERKSADSENTKGDLSNREKGKGLIIVP